MFCKESAFLILYLVTVTGNADETILEQFLSGNEQARRIILNEIILERKEKFNNGELLLLARKASHLLEPEEVRKSALEAIWLSSRAPTYGAPVDRLPAKITDVLFEIVKNERNSEVILEYAAHCLLLSMDNSKQGVANEERMISLLDGDFSGKVSEVYYTSPRHFSLQKNGVAWKSIVATLQSETVKEKWRRQLYESLEAMETAKLLTLTDCFHLLKVAYSNPNCNVQCRTIILTKEAWMRSYNGITAVPDWVRETVEEHYLNDEMAGPELAYFVSRVARIPTGDKIILEKAIERVMEPKTETAIRRDSLKIVLNFQGDQKTLFKLLESVD